MSKRNYIILFVTIVVIITLYLLFSCRCFKKSILKYDKELKNLLYSDFDSPAVMPEDSDRETYMKNGQFYIKGSGAENMDKTFVRILDSIQNETGVKIANRINSGYRSEHYNSQLEGAVPESAHTKGLAVDISTANMTETEKNNIIDYMKNKGIERIGFYSNFLHFDIDNSKPQIAWTG